MDHLDPKERQSIARLHAGLVGFYMLLLVGLMFAVKLHSPKIEIAADGFSAAAAERPHMAACAERDLKLIIALADHGEAQDVPAGKLNTAFLALVEARAACAAGRIDEALAIYDGIAIGPVPKK
jgi:hypothetical protein